jgi:hypothetical protein
LRRASASIEGATVDPDDVMAAGRELEGEEAGSAPGVERVERAPAGEDEIENSVPGGALGGGADLWPKSSSKCGARRSQWAATCCLTTSVWPEVMR